jgi:hypothetical protein
MVYSQTKRTSSMASITNQNQGGGSKKAGLPYLIGRDSTVSVALNNHTQYMGKLDLPLTSTTISSRGIGMRYNIR